MQRAGLSLCSRPTKDKRVMALYHQFYNSPYSFVAVQAMAKALHPDRFKDVDPQADLAGAAREVPAGRAVRGLLGQRCVTASIALPRGGFIPPRGTPPRWPLVGAGAWRSCVALHPRLVDRARAATACATWRDAPRPRWRPIPNCRSWSGTCVCRSQRWPCLVGAMLGLAGAGMQTILGNPLADPFTLGVSAAASVGAALAIAFGWASYPAPGRSSSPSTPSSSRFAASLVALRADASCAASRRRRWCSSASRSCSRSNAILAHDPVPVERDAAAADRVLDDGQPRSRELREDRDLRRRACGRAAVDARPRLGAHGLAARRGAGGERWASGRTGCGSKYSRSSRCSRRSSVSFVGTIGFVGLVGPHIARLVVGEDQRFFLPVAALASAILLSLASTLSKAITPGVIYPIGMITALIGVPFFISLILSIRNRGA